MRSLIPFQDFHIRTGVVGRGGKRSESSCIWSICSKKTHNMTVLYCVRLIEDVALEFELHQPSKQPSKMQLLNFSKSSLGGKTSHAFGEDHH